MANQIQLVMYEGYLTDEPTMRYLPSGKAVTNFSIGSTEQFKNSNGEQVKNTTWLRVTAWGKLAEIVNDYCGKGTHVIVTGNLKADETGNPKVYQKNDGEWASSFEVTAREVRIIKVKEGAFSKNSSGGGGLMDEVDEPLLVDDEVPF